MAEFQVQSTYSLLEYSIAISPSGVLKIVSLGDAKLVASFDLSYGAISLRCQDDNLQVGLADFGAEKIEVKIELGSPRWSFGIDVAARAGIGIDDLRDAGRSSFDIDDLRDAVRSLQVHRWDLSKMPIRLSFLEGILTVQTAVMSPEILAKGEGWYTLSTEVPQGSR